MLTFVVQIALLGWLCGRLLFSTWWRWGLYLWGWILVDLQLATATTYMDGWRAEGSLPASLLAAQVGLAIVWAILGDTHWAIRLPTCVVLGTLLTLPMDLGYGIASDSFPTQLFALAMLCLLFRWRGFRVQRVEIDGAAPAAEVATPGAGARPPTGGRLQFNIRHVLIWTTSLALVLGVLRFLDLLSLEAWIPYFGRSVIASLTGGLLLACVFVVSLWAALGSGPLWLRLSILLFALVSGGFTLGLIHFYSNLSPNVSYAQRWSWAEDGGYVTWVFLAGSLLAASLVILRVVGYRLVRLPVPPRIPNATPQVRI